MAEYMQVATTVDSEEEAERLARGITGARLGSGVQIVGPMRSFYWWQGVLEDTHEWRLTIGTTTERLGQLEAYIKANHSYVTPQIIATEIQWGSQEYLDWISAETRTDAS